MGRLDHGKNHKLIIDAIKVIDADLWIIGDGELKSELQRYIKELNLNDKVYLLGKKKIHLAFYQKLIVLYLLQIMKDFQMYW